MGLNIKATQNNAQGAGLYAGWELIFRLPGPLLIENI